MAKLVLTEAESAVRDAIGARAFAKARSAVARGDLTDVRWDRLAGRGRAKVRGAGNRRVTASVVHGADGAVKSIDGKCPCTLAPACMHVAALVLLAYQADPANRQVVSAWESALAALVGAGPTAGSSAERVVPPDLALQFELEGDDSSRIGLRPVIPGRKGWVRGGISWGSLDFAYRPSTPRAKHHLSLMHELHSLARTGDRGSYSYGYYSSGQRVLYLDEFRSRRVWDLLAEAQDAGLPLVRSGRQASQVGISTRPVRYSVRAAREGADLRLRPVLVDGTEEINPARLIVIGEPVHGVAWSSVSGQAKSDDLVSLRLAPLAGPMSAQALAALTAPEIVIPAADEPRFLRQYYPGLIRRTEVVSLDGSAALPAVQLATLTLTAQRMPGHRMSLAWEWIATVGEETYREPLHSGAAGNDDRATALRLATDLVADSAYGLTEPAPGGPRLLGHTSVAGDAMLRIMRDVFPRIVEAPGIDLVVRMDDDVPEYIEEDAAPILSFAGSANEASAGPSDWYDLSVQVSVGGEDVGFEDLFVALAGEQEFMILPSGRYFRLDQAELRQLRDLIAEARELQDAPAGVLRVGRFQAGLWNELSELGEVTGQAAAWQEAVRTLDAADVNYHEAAPTGLVADLRPYQLDGFQWLTALYRHELGGVLADDMGLGKTLQALALICHAFEQSRAEAPFLVVAPASVVSNWAHEAARFAPGLAITSIVQTGARRLETLGEAVTGAHIVVTSYTLFRLEYDEYAALPWAGLVLDEAQFVKNAQSQSYQCAKRLPVAFKLAITGTPMENNLAELWALLSISAPGLLPRLDRFTDYYRKPIERDHDEARLDQLRRRIRPLMLRRRKAEVVTELPAKQEQIIELELNPRHRKMYQTYLQRERQKVLGLLGDLQKNRFEIFRSLTLLRQASLDLSLVDPKHHGIASTKLDALTERLTDLAAEGHRVLVFSQFTRFLGAARQRLDDAGIACCYLDGKTRQRAKVIAEFKNGTAPVFLVSLKSGGFGLNLTEADYCILLDPWWNPATEAQAVDRVHRIGQTRKVMVYRLVAKDTIEQKVMALQARKAELFSSVLDGGEFASAQLTVADIRGLLD
ncbi:DEAD/DEAH box helicase [Winogradskya consettensis]|uniref:DNA helicase n=1 Tax=Winogradskya consettensis TaxID=113560 RepID=A0A919T0U9_9ACTN|nr:DNA helicase [Actinoplanes consettensis]